MIDRKTINWAELRSVSAFKQLTDSIAKHLDFVRSRYEDEPASEFNRGQVYCLKSLLEDMTNSRNLK